MSETSDVAPGEGRDGRADPTDALREAAVTLASRIRIALPYRRATTRDIADVDAAIATLHAASLDDGDEVLVELKGLRETLEILAI